MQVCERAFKRTLTPSIKVRILIIQPGYKGSQANKFESLFCCLLFILLEVDKQGFSGIIPRYRLVAEVHGSLVGPSDFKSDVGR